MKLTKFPLIHCFVNHENNSSISVKTEYGFEVQKQDGMNVLGLVVFSVALGIVISRLGDVGKPLYDVFYAMAEASMKLVIVIIW